MSDNQAKAIEPWLQALWEQGGTDLLLSGGSPPRIRVDGKLIPLPGAPYSLESKLTRLLSRFSPRVSKQSSKSRWMSTSPFLGMTVPEFVGVSLRRGGRRR